MDRNVLKSAYYSLPPKSLSARRAWIEIDEQIEQEVVPESLSARRAWIEILYQLYDTYAKVSLSARRAWIEMEEFMK